jgi:DNA-nicking Smr family endonuclease
VPDFINSDDDLKNYIISIEEAKKKDGGDGAILIKLKNL